MGLAKAALESSTRYLAASLGREGIRANAISAGPIKTLAASGIQDFSKLLHAMEEVAPLGRTVTIDEVGNTAAFLLSDLASGITGNIAYVDAGLPRCGGGRRARRITPDSTGTFVTPQAFRRGCRIVTASLHFFVERISREPQACRSTKMSPSS